MPILRRTYLRKGRDSRKTLSLTILRPTPQAFNRYLMRNAQNPEEMWVGVKHLAPRNIVRVCFAGLFCNTSALSPSTTYFRLQITLLES